MFFAFVGISVFSLAGCSTTKPIRRRRAATPLRPEKTEAANKRFAKAPVSQSSSLDQRQQAKPVGTAPSSPLKDIYFAFDRYDLHTDARDTLEANPAWLQHNPARSVQIEGHCDERRVSEYNLAPGAKRAQMAKDYLVNLGIAQQRLSTIATAKSCPYVASTTKSAGKKTGTIASSSRPARRVNIAGTR